MTDRPMAGAWHRRTMAPVTQPTNRFAPTAIDRVVERVRTWAPSLAGLSSVLLALCVGVFGGFDLIIGRAYSLDSGDHAIWPWGVVVLVLAATAAATARERRLTLAVSGLAALSIAMTAFTVWRSATSVPSLAMLFSVALLTMRIVRFKAVPAAVGLSLLAAAVVASEFSRVNDSSAASVAIAAEMCLSFAVAVGVYLRWSDWRRREAAAAARTDERLEIARELHDLVGHYVTGMVVQAQAARHVADNNPTAAVEALARIEAAGGDAMAAMRRMVGGLRDDTPLAPGATWDDLGVLVADASAEGLPIRLDIDPAVLDLSADLSSSVYRIVTESLTNARRHARDATRIDVEVRLDAGAVMVNVTDDGLATAATSHDTYGLVGMAERAEALGGSLLAGPVPTGGWLVSATLPLERAS